MAHEETSCSDNYTLSQGSQGPIGATGQTGATGPQGIPGQVGPSGPSGSFKIDISIQKNSLPYHEINSQNENSYQDIAYFIFPGTANFTPSSLKVGLSIKATNPATTFTNLKLMRVSSSGVLSEVATIVLSSTASGGTSSHIFQIHSTSTFYNLPTTQEVFLLQGASNFLAGQQESRIYTLELS